MSHRSFLIGRRSSRIRSPILFLKRSLPNSQEYVPRFRTTMIKLFCKQLTPDIIHQRAWWAGSKQLLMTQLPTVWEGRPSRNHHHIRSFRQDLISRGASGFFNSTWRLYRLRRKRSHRKRRSKVRAKAQILGITVAALMPEMLSRTLEKHSF